MLDVEGLYAYGKKRLLLLGKGHTYSEKLTLQKCDDFVHLEET